MKTIMKLTGIMLFLVLFSCSKENSSPNNDVENTVSADASLDNSSAGVYKGIIVGSMGHFKLSIKNGNTTISCKLKFDNVSVTLVNSSLENWQPGQSISGAVFTGTLNGQTITLVFSCNADGTDPFVTISIPNHTTVVEVFKEKSSDQVKCYEGTYSIKYVNSTETGNWTIVCDKKEVIGYKIDTDGKTSITGEIKGSKLFLDEDNVELNINGNSISGSYNNSQGGFVTITGSRSL